METMPNKKKTDGKEVTGMQGKQKQPPTQIRKGLPRYRADKSLKRGMGILCQDKIHWLYASVKHAHDRQCFIDFDSRKAEFQSCCDLIVTAYYKWVSKSTPRSWQKSTTDIKTSSETNIPTGTKTRLARFSLPCPLPKKSRFSWLQIYLKDSIIMNKIFRWKEKYTSFNFIPLISQEIIKTHITLLPRKINYIKSCDISVKGIFKLCFIILITVLQRLSNFQRKARIRTDLCSNNATLNDALSTFWL